MDDCGWPPAAPEAIISGWPHPAQPYPQPRLQLAFRHAFGHTPGTHTPGRSNIKDKTRENRLRRVAERYGYRLSRSTRRDPEALDYGLYALFDLQSGGAVNPALIDRFAHSWTLDDVEQYLTKSRNDMADIIKMDPREFIKRNVTRILTPEDHDPEQWALAVVDGCAELGRTLTQGELEIIVQQSAAPIPVEAMVDEICNPDPPDDE